MCLQKLANNTFQITALRQSNVFEKRLPMRAHNKPVYWTESVNVAQHRQHAQPHMHAQVTCCVFYSACQSLMVKLCEVRAAYSLPQCSAYTAAALKLHASGIMWNGVDTVVVYMTVNTCSSSLPLQLELLKQKQGSWSSCWSTKPQTHLQQNKRHEDVKNTSHSMQPRNPLHLMETC